MSISSGSVVSLESLWSDGCPVCPSPLYDLRARLYETRQRQCKRRAVTEYTTKKSKTISGVAIECRISRRDDFVEKSQSFRPRERPSSQEPTFIRM
jgi:hypothetical protein